MNLTRHISTLLSILIIPGIICAQCADDCIWPGDANDNEIVTVHDLLPIGLGFGTTGPARPNASLNWEAQNMHHWNDSAQNGLNLVHADCNGDGIINAMDTVAINLHYHKTHNKSEIHASHLAGDVILKPDIKQDTVGLSQEVEVDIILGSDIDPAQNVYGLAFKIFFNTENIDPDKVSLDLSNSWLGNSSELLAMSKNFNGTGEVDFGITRTDQTNKTGFGPIATMRIITADNLAGKLNKAANVNFQILDVTIITKNADTIDVTVEEEDLVIEDPTNSLPPGKLEQFEIYPNPINTNGTLYIRATNQNFNFNQFGIFDLSGQEIMSGTMKQDRIGVKNLSPGTYILKLKRKDVSFYHRFLIK